MAEAASTCQRNTKRCTACREEKPLDHFHKDKGRAGGYGFYCKPCNIAKVVAWQKENTKRYRDRQRAWEAEHGRKDGGYIDTDMGPLRNPTYYAGRLTTAAKKRAKRDGIPFDIDREFVLEKVKQGVCELSGVRLVHNKHKMAAYSATLDKIVPSNGYTKENTRLVCWAMNAALGTWGEGVAKELWAAALRRDKLKGD